MTDRVKLTFWNYNDFSGYKPHMLRDWVECGMTDSISPQFSFRKHSHDDFRAFLDDALALGTNVIIQVDELFLDNALNQGYEEIVKEIYDEFGTHPAVTGAYVGEEPSFESNEHYKTGVRILKKYFSEKHIYINLGSTERTERMLLIKTGQTLDQWCGEMVNDSHADMIGFGCYSQLMANGIGVYEHFDNLRQFSKVGRETGAEIWATMLSSSHDTYRIPTEDDFRWQLNTCVACGCRGVVWFRLYDKLVAADYHGSPIDEFGEKTVHYYDLARVQKKFNTHYGKIFSKLNYQNTYVIGRSHGGYLFFLPGMNDLVESASSRAAIISFFKDDEGGDWIAVVNTLQTESGPVILNFSEKVNKAEKVYYNGEVKNVMFTRNGRNGTISSGEIWLTPGQMELIKLS